MKHDLSDLRIRALPVQVIEAGEDVILKRGRTEVRVSGPGACAVVERLLALLGGEGLTRESLLGHFLPPDRPAVEALLDHLLARRLFTDDEGWPTGEAESATDLFYWHFGTTAARVRGSLAGKRFLVAGVNRISRQLLASLKEEGQGGVEVVDVPVLRDLALFGPDGTPRAESWHVPLVPGFIDVSGPSAVDPARFDCLIATCSHGGQECFREWNAFCVLHGRPFLPVCLDDLVGYVGPLVIPGETACFECLHLRRDSHRAGGSAYAGSPEDGRKVPAAFHPSMAVVLAEVAALELVRFYGVGTPWWRVGSVIEFNLLAPTLTARKVLRLPRCPVCTGQRERSVLT